MKEHICPPADLLNEYADGRLSGARRSALERHLAACASCRAEVRRVERLREVLRRAVAPEAPADLPAHIRRQVARTAPVPVIACRQARRLMTEELDGQIASADHERLWAHLFNCVGCLRQFQETRRMVGSLRRPAPVAPPELAGRIRAAIAGLAPRRQRRPAVRWAPVGAVAAAVLVVAVLATQFARAPATGPALPRNSQMASQPAPEPAPGTPIPATAATSPAPPATPSAAERFRAWVTRETTPSAPPVTLPAVITSVGNGSERPIAYRPASPATPAVSGPASSAPEAPEPLRVSSPPPPAPQAAPAPAPEPETPAPARVAYVPAPSPAAAAAPPVEGEHPLVSHNSPEQVRQLRWVPVQPASVVVFQRDGGNDQALAQVDHAINSYERHLQRSQPRMVVVVVK
jgi:anti-sigma factor RsiW